MAAGANIVFMGTPRFAALALEKMLTAGLNVSAVYTQPDRPAGRGMTLHQSEVKQLAQKYDLPVYQPVNFRSSDDIAPLAALAPDYLVVASYGLILPQAVLDIPKIAPVNLHASLLPKYRGAAPIQRAIQENWGPDAKTGISLMRIVLALDAGPVYGKTEIPIGHKNAATLCDELAWAGADLLIRLLPELPEIEPKQQEESKATYAAKLERTDGKIDWHKPVLAVDAHVRAMQPRPGAYTTLDLNGKSLPVTIHSGRPANFDKSPQPGKIIYSAKKLLASCKDGWYEILTLQQPGRKELSAANFANGLRLASGATGRAD